MKTKNVFIACVTLLLLGCKNEVKNIENDADTIVAKVDSALVDIKMPAKIENWQGTYKGILPCADCEGIQTTLTLNTDNTYTLSTVYLGKGNGKPVEDSGSFTWDDTEGVISLIGLEETSPYLYKVGDNSLTQLDMQGYPITGSLASKYILKK